METKFRAWDGKTMIYDVIYVNENAVIEHMQGFPPIAQVLYRHDIVAVMQSIRVKGYVGDYKDRKQNEVDLYEGDIVEAMSEGSKGQFIIKYRNSGNPMWLLWPNWQCQQHWNISASDIGRKPGDYYDDLKRIGNIYENPELISQYSK